jgi:CDP-paratose 2-epimerase
MKVLITGGAGFVGSYLALSFLERDSTHKLVAFDNLKRRGSELNLGRLRRAGVRFIHGDLRNAEDFEALSGNFDLLIDASAEPSVLAGVTDSPSYVLSTNLGGTLTCLEFAKRRAGGIIFLSTSRVYSIEPLRNLKLRETKTRFELEAAQSCLGVSDLGIDETFPTHLPRSFYGASKLASEMIIQEYSAQLQFPSVINRCGVIAGPGQFGKSDQGVFTHWVASHAFQRPLKYTGFGGEGKQVRDLLHPADLSALIHKEIDELSSLRGDVFNVGGGLSSSLSLKELTELCRQVIGSEVPIASDPQTHSVDIPVYVSNCQKVKHRFGWVPQRTPVEIVQEIAEWLEKERASLEPLWSPEVSVSHQA